MPAERTRSEGEARLAAVLESAVDGIMTIDEAGRIESFNPAAERLFGYSESEVVGRNVSILMPPPFREEHDGYLAAYRRSGEARIIGVGREVSARRKDGTVFPIHLSVGEARLGERRLFTGIVRDLTARKELEEQLRVSQKMQAAGQLAGGVAHDFNNILLTILGRSDAMLRGLPPGSPLRPQLEEIRKAGRRAAQLTRQLLALSRRQVLDPRLVDLNAVLEDTAGMLRRLVDEDVVFHVDLEPELPPVRVDPDQIGQVLLNLVVNARDAMPRGGTLSIETRDSSRATAGLAGEGRAVLLAVRDTGCGMSEELRARIFEPYFTTKGDQGTGLGLSTVYGIVEQSGGVIRVESREGVGSAFSIFLPADEGEVEVAAEVPATPRAANPGRSAQVLLVEDDAPARRALEEFLREEGHTVYAAGDAPEAERLWEQHAAHLDIVVTDTVMPGISGPDLIRRLRERRPGLKALFMSGHTPETIRVRGGGLEGTAFLQKPFDIDDLLGKVRELVAEPPPGDPPEGA